MAAVSYYFNISAEKHLLIRDFSFISSTGSCLLFEEQKIQGLTFLPARHREPTAPGQQTHCWKPPPRRRRSCSSHEQRIMRRTWTIEGCGPFHTHHLSGFKVKKLSYHNATEQRCWDERVFTEISHRQAFKCKVYLISWLKCRNPGVSSGLQGTTTHFSLKVQIWVMCTLQRHANQALILMNDIHLREN